MATSSFDRPFKLTPKGAERFFEIAMKPSPPDKIKPYSYEEQKESEELLKRYWFNNKNSKTE